MKDALAARADVSDQFTSKVADLCRKLEADSGLKLAHVKEMNYRSSQRLQLCLDASGSPSPPPVAKWLVEFFLSSKAPLFAYRIFERTSEAEESWQPKSPKSDPAEALPLLTRVAEALERHDWAFVSASEWGTIAPGCSTEMDGVPATVFEALFAELL